MPKNKIEDLRNHMFAQLERLSDEGLSPDKMQMEIERATAIANVGNVIVNSAKAEFMVMKHFESKGTGFFPDDADKKVLNS